MCTTFITIDGTEAVINYSNLICGVFCLDPIYGELENLSSICVLMGLADIGIVGFSTFIESLILDNLKFGTCFAKLQHCMEKF